VGKRLVTVASFDQPAQARLAQNALTDAGIAAAVSDESIVAMDWLLSNAVGGVKVQVWEEDAEKAVDVLESKFGKDGEGLQGNVSLEELTREAESATPDKGEEPELPSPEPDAPEKPPTAPDSRDNFARKLVFTAFLGLVFPPFLFYAVYLFLNAAFGEGSLSSGGRLNLWIGGVTLLTGLLLIPFDLKLLSYWLS
jgi:hypothetical protein